MLHIPIVHAHDISKRVPWKKIFLWVENVIKQLVHTSAVRSSRYEALGKLRIFCALQTSRVLHVSINTRWHMNQLLIKTSQYKRYVSDQYYYQLNQLPQSPSYCKSVSRQWIKHYMEKTCHHVKISHASKRNKWINNLKKIYGFSAIKSYIIKT